MFDHGICILNKNTVPCIDQTVKACGETWRQTDRPKIQKKHKKETKLKTVTEYLRGLNKVNRTAQFVTS